MYKNEKYLPLDAMKYPRFCGIGTFMRLPHQKDVSEVDIAIAGVPFDTGATHRIGARFGPEGIRQHSRLLRYYNPAQKVHLFKHITALDYGDFSIMPGYIYDSFDMITEQAYELFKQDIIPIFMGGGHEVSFPLLRAAYKQHGEVALIHFDAHTDLWEGYFGGKDMNGTPFRRAYEQNILDVAHSIQVGIRGPLYDEDDYTISEKLGFQMIDGPALHEMGMKACIQEIQKRVGNKKAYVTFDIDFLDPVFAPGTGTPEVGGFTGYEALQLIRGLKGLDIIGFDIVEVNPSFDHAGVTCGMAANMMYEFMSLVALRNKEAP